MGFDTASEVSASAVQKESLVLRFLPCLCTAVRLNPGFIFRQRPGVFLTPLLSVKRSVHLLGVTQQVAKLSDIISTPPA